MKISEEKFNKLLKSAINCLKTEKYTRYKLANGGKLYDYGCKYYVYFK